MPKCKLCKKEVDKSVAYVTAKIDKNGKVIRTYYCSEDELNAHKKEMEYKDLSYDLLKDYLNIEPKQVVPSIIVKEVYKLREGYSYRAIYNVLKSMESNIRYWMNLDGKFNSEYHKAKYLMALITNNIQDEYLKIKRENKVGQQRVQDNIDIDIVEIASTQRERKVKDISDFLD